MKEIYLTRKAFDDTEAKRMQGVKLTDSSYDLLITESSIVYKPNKEVLLKFVKNAVRRQHAATAYQILRKVNSLADNRGRATEKGSLSGKLGRHRQLKSGYLSNTIRADKQKTGISGIIGYFDRYPRFPYARETAFIQQNPENWQALQPFIRSCDHAFAAFVPERYAIQRAIADATAQEWVIKGTSFTTITVNKNWQTAVHKDSGDLGEGFGVMAYLQAGTLTGGYLVFPQYRVAVFLESCDIVFFDSHEWHGNTPIVGKPRSYERITAVFYYREALLRCGSADYEIERAKRCRQIGKLYDDHEINRATALKNQIISKQVNAANISNPCA